MAIQTCQADLKVQKVMAARMEIDLLDKKLQETFYQAVFSCTKLQQGNPWNLMCSRGQ
jgi:hypothetical protein